MVQPDVSVIVIVDTSGSISSQRLGLALGTIHAILRVLRIRVRVLSWDAAFQGIQEVSTVRDVVLKGGGGTDMAAALQYAQECRPRPDLVVVVTDGYTPWPKEAPRVPMIVFRFEESASAQLGTGNRTVLTCIIFNDQFFMLRKEVV
jgi:predicted metal-dependent peptidase